ncbi:MAG TPA: RluA family pseudouridine synthase [Solirubrobacteraceae bacterium]|jgi:23S rRNA pseudouridine1911/1915/1917 synthase|nr:RluA family pseudouridine synthase [Solirubrobacteraceae bacterium]
MPEVEWEGTVGPDDAGARLDQFLADPLVSRARAARLIAAGLVEVDGRAVQKRYLVTAGERVVVAAETFEAAPVSGPAPAQFAIAYEDDALIVVDKPAGVVVHPARGHESGTLAQALADRAAGGEEPYRAGIVHRLDRDTSGLLVVAKSDAVHRALKDLLQDRELSREYVTLVDGVPPAHSGTIDAPIGRDRRDRLLHSIDTDAPREARTHFELLEPLRHEALLRVSLETGRTHQIRVHMQAIGHPVLGDSAYGGPVRFGLERQFLHAARLAFPHPVTGEEIDVSSSLPADLEAALALARARQP